MTEAKVFPNGKSITRYLEQYYLGFKDLEYNYLGDFYHVDQDEFDLELGSEIIKKILEDIVRENFLKTAATKEPIVSSHSHNKEKSQDWEEKMRKGENSLGNNETSSTSKSGKSGKSESKTKRHNRHTKSKKKSSTQEKKKGKIEEIPVQTTSDDDLDKYFAKQSRDLKFYDFPKDVDIYETLKKVGYVERLEVKWNYKSKEEHEELDDLNNKFSESLDKMTNKTNQEEKGTTSTEQDEVNENKKCVVTAQG
ncbi:hypothetical protein GLOIN_2v1777573 [Rhizophagus irregularis DAOM 181602=DAOM 197198]|nr:hypothetical protein GLOIN_2v1777573 [Rhizophagus irregularis DAOM 181602=DAOM 197198]